MPDPVPVDLRDPAAFGHWVDESVRFCDTDMLGHVNNVAYAAYVESGRLAYAFERFVEHTPSEITAILRRIELDYLRELRYPADIRVGTCLIGLGETSFTVGSGVFAGSSCVATAHSVLVLTDGQRARPVEGRLRRRLERALDETSSRVAT